MERSFMTILIVLALLVLQPAFAATMQFNYIPPDNLALSLAPTGDAQPGKAFSLIGTIEPRTGVPAKLQVFFETSDDMSVSPGSKTIERLTAPVRFDLQVKPASGKPDAGGSWVRLRVVYSPDYPAQAKEMTDATRYPNPSERKRVLDLISRNQKEKARQTDATRFFPQPPQAR